MKLSVVLPTRNPRLESLERTLAALAVQTLERGAWELVLVDNASDRPWETPAKVPANFRRVSEPVAGLTPARLRGIAESRGEILVFADDDNLLAPDYLSRAISHMAAMPRLGAAGGRVRPEFEQEPPAWTREFWSLLALRDFGEVPLVRQGGAGVAWPSFAPVGAGLVVRREAAIRYANDLSASPDRRALDRRAGSLASGGDSDLVFTTLHAGMDVAYLPDLLVTHLIPSARFAPRYLADLNAGVMRTWVRVLSLHGQCPWPPVSRQTVPLRCLRAWWRFRAWRSHAHRVRWRGACGQFMGQADLSR